jgi:hypothetical protein
VILDGMMMICDFGWDDDDGVILDGLMMVWFWMGWWWCDFGGYDNGVILDGMMKCDCGWYDDVWFWMVWWCVNFFFWCIIVVSWGLVAYFGGIETSSSGHLHSNMNSAHTLTSGGYGVQNDSVFVHYSYAKSPLCTYSSRRNNNSPFLCCILLSKQKKTMKEFSFRFLGRVITYSKGPCGREAFPIHPSRHPSMDGIIQRRKPWQK